MCAAVEAGSDFTGRARIRDAALRRFGIDGFSTPLRAIAADAGVSPGLVIHHFGSKDGLRSVCDEHVLRMIRESERQSVLGGGPVDFISQMAALDSFAPLVGYLLQALLAGGELAVTLLTRLTEDAERYLADGVVSGTLRPSRDPKARAAFLVDVGMGGMLAFLRRRPAPADGDYRALLRECAEAMSLPALEIYTEGLLTDSSALDAYLKYRDSTAGS